jgi:hypothetical protein
MSAFLTRAAVLRFHIPAVEPLMLVAAVELPFIRAAEVVVCLITVVVEEAAETEAEGVAAAAVAVVAAKPAGSAGWWE